MAGLYLEEFVVGHVFRHTLRKTVTESDNMLFSVMTLNPQPLHIDFDFAAKSEWGKPLVNSLFTLGLMIGISVNDITVGTTVANLGMKETVFPHPVFHGDTIRVETTVMSVARIEIEARPRHRRIRAPRLQPERRSRRQMHPAGDDAEEAGLTMRSLLFVPGDSERKLEKGFCVRRRRGHRRSRGFRRAAKQGAGARRSPRGFIAARGDQTRAAIYVRVNDLSTGLTDDDLAALVPAKPDGIMLPKSNSGATCSTFRRSCACTRPRTACPTAASGSCRSSPRPRPACSPRRAMPAPARGSPA